MESTPERIGRYEILGSVGGGGMGDVYRVFDPATRRQLALKVLKFTYPRALHYFKREFRAVAGLHHPNLVTLYDLHYEAGRYFYTMELIDGVDLYLYVNGHNRIVSDPAKLCHPDRLSRIRSAFIQLLCALDYLHGQGCIHRDIKPSNILVDRQGRVRLVDFGIVKELLPGGEGQSLSQVFGTSTYFSPEQSLGSRVSSATDLYAAGVVLYELLAGTPPFEGEGPEVAIAHRTTPPPSLIQRVPGTDPGLAVVCMELLSKEPTERPSAREALEMLDARQDLPAPEPEFVGRRTVRKQLHQALEAVRGGEGRLVLIEGGSGSGKSALVKTFIQDALLFGAVAFAGTCVHRDHVPLRGLDTVVERLAEAYRKQAAKILRGLPAAERASLIDAFTFLGELLPAAQHRGPVTELGAGLGLNALLTGLGDKRLLVLAVEHVHLADDTTFEVLETLQLGGKLPPALILLTLRPEAVAQNSRAAAFLEVAEALPSATRIPLGPLKSDEIRQVLDEHLDSVTDKLAEHVLAQTGGLPLYVTAMIRDLKRHPGPPPTFEEMVARRIASLSVPAQRVLAAVCQSPGAVPDAVIERALAQDGAELHTTLAELEAAELVRLEVSSAGHTDVMALERRLMDVARSGLDHSQTLAIHETLARAYELSGGQAADVRFHWTAAGQPERAHRYAAQAAADARVAKDHARAAQMLELALEGAISVRQRLDFRTQLADSLAESGRYLEAAAVLERLSREIPVEAPRLSARKCQLYLMGGDLAAFAQHVERLPAAARVPLADLLVPLAPLLAEALLGDSDTTEARLIRARVLADQPNPKAIARAAELVEGASAEALVPDLDRRVAYAIAKAMVQWAQGDLQGAQEGLEDPTLLPAAALNGRPRYDLAELRLLSARSEVALARGRLGQARGPARLLLAEARARGLTGLQAQACIVLARIFMESGERAAGERLLDEARRFWPSSPVAMPHVHLALGRARGLLYAGQPEAAQDALTAIYLDEVQRPLLGRRKTSHEFAVLRGRALAVQAVNAFKADVFAAELAEELTEAAAALDRVMPRPEGWQLVFLTIADLAKHAPQGSLDRLDSHLQVLGWPEDPQVCAILRFASAAAWETLGHDGEIERDEGRRVVREAGAALPPEAEALA